MIDAFQLLIGTGFFIHMETKEQEHKTPWKKNLDKRYISGEDLQFGNDLGKGLRPEMVVTIAKHEDSPAFDQKKQAEVDKTALWLKEFPSGKMLYKPMLVNVAAAEFLTEEISGGSIYIEDADLTKPFIIYALPHKKHGFVARLKKYYPPSNVKPDNAIKLLGATTTLAELGEVWGKLSIEEKNLPSVIAEKDHMKGVLPA